MHYTGDDDDHGPRSEPDDTRSEPDDTRSEPDDTDDTRSEPDDTDDTQSESDDTRSESEDAQSESEDFDTDDENYTRRTDEFFRCTCCGHRMYPCTGEIARETLWNNLSRIRECCENDPTNEQRVVAERVLRGIEAATPGGLSPACLVPDSFGFTALSYFTMHRNVPHGRRLAYFVALATRLPSLLHLACAYGPTPMSVMALSSADDDVVCRLVDLPATDDGWRATMSDIVHECLRRPVYVGRRLEHLPDFNRSAFAHGVRRDPEGVRALIEAAAQRVRREPLACASRLEEREVDDGIVDVKDRLLRLCDEFT